MAIVGERHHGVIFADDIGRALIGYVKHDCTTCLIAAVVNDFILQPMTARIELCQDERCFVGAAVVTEEASATGIALARVALLMRDVVNAVFPLRAVLFDAYRCRRAIGDGRRIVCKAVVGRHRSGIVGQRVRSAEQCGCCGVGNDDALACRYLALGWRGTPVDDGPGAQDFLGATAGGNEVVFVCGVEPAASVGDGIARHIGVWGTLIRRLPAVETVEYGVA